ncbi:hypothetical protein BLA60_33830 [Actinophytocola xinjiangensis]|uniref:RNA polymerase sigma factor (Sigma-70 family) n=1 Tax=Actinophytocola xinjiangensis TaxID=485602 RepID=A0A7Z0WFF0_9PSEU|nr:sigma-70 family RNA polymerase sigma factor [Actinophytocola xinjiangensis]OLF06026.1 hypothetical protein BLA60_33830 [Actinophytocola xinjiangensis]
MSTTDADLIEQVRVGRLSAYGVLYERHVDAAYTAARRLARSPADADDLVSESFASVLDALRAGRGPDLAFRAYLLTVLRNAAYATTRLDQRVRPTGEIDTGHVEPVDASAFTELERMLASRAFTTLPERWQAVLWHTEVDRLSPAEAAPLLGLNANAVTSLAYRAREGLRQAYLQAHLADTAGTCQTVAGRLGAWTRSGVGDRERRTIDDHLRTCARCRSLAVQLAEANNYIYLMPSPNTRMWMPAMLPYDRLESVAQSDMAVHRWWPRRLIATAVAAGVATAAILVVVLVQPDPPVIPPHSPYNTVTTTTR